MPHSSEDVNPLSDRRQTVINGQIQPSSTIQPSSMSQTTNTMASPYSPPQQYKLSSTMTPMIQYSPISHDQSAQLNYGGFPPVAYQCSGVPGMYPPQYHHHQPFNYQQPMVSPSLSSSNSFSPAGPGSPQMTSARFPDSPPILDASQMLMSPSRFRKRRQLSPLISGYSGEPLRTSPNMLLRRAPMPKLPVSPGALGASPKAAKPANLILPCFFDQHNNLRSHGSGVEPGSGYYDDTRRNVRSFLQDAASIDEDNVTIIEIKQLLRRYCINATGKKVVLMDRIKRLQIYLNRQLEMESGALLTESSPQTETNCVLPPPEAAENKTAARENTIQVNVLSS